jgi:transcriptional regulator with XRE-family HTH domain
MAGDTLGKRIRDARERKHLTQQELGDLVHKSVRAVNDWENDRTYPKNSMGALEHVLETSLGEDTGTNDGRGDEDTDALDRLEAQATELAELARRLRDQQNRRPGRPEGRSAAS